METIWKDLANSVRQAAGQVDPEQRITNLRMMDEVVSAAVARPRFDSLLMAAFASLALVLTSIGIYGLLSYRVNQRRHEIGIRMALGARPGDVLQLIVWQGVKVISIGIAAGIAGALALARLMANLHIWRQAERSKDFYWSGGLAVRGGLRGILLPCAAGDAPRSAGCLTV